MHYLTFQDDNDYLWGIPIPVLAQLYAQEQTQADVSLGINTYHESYFIHHSFAINYPEETMMWVERCVDYATIQPHLKLIQLPDDNVEYAWKTNQLTLEEHYGH